jgi:hypothetical protein
LQNATSDVSGFRRTFLPASVIGFFNGALQPHLDQMQHAPINDASRERQHQFGVWNTSKVVRKVSINNVRLPSMQPLLHLDHRLLGISPRAISVLLS